MTLFAHRSVLIHTVVWIVTGCSYNHDRLDSRSSKASNRVEAQSVFQICPAAETTTVLSATSTARVAGRVFYDEGQNPRPPFQSPLEAVKLVLFKGPPTAPELLFVAETDATGRFLFDALLEPGDYRLLTCLDGWDAVEMVLRVLSTGEDRELVLAIKPS